MRMAAATAGLVSTAVLLVPGCDRPPAPRRDAPDPVRRAAYRSFAARDFLATCAEAARRGETGRERDHFEQLKLFAAQKGKGAGQSLWLGENDWNAVSRVAPQARCGTGDAAYEKALAGFRGALDQFAGAIAEHRE